MRYGWIGLASHWPRWFIHLWAQGLGLSKGDVSTPPTLLMGCHGYDTFYLTFLARYRMSRLCYEHDVRPSVRPPYCNIGGL